MITTHRVVMPPKQLTWPVPLTNAPPDPRKYTTEKDWEQYKDYILGLRKENMSLPQIRRTLLEQKGFDATQAMYKIRLKAWNDRKYLTKTQRRYIEQQILSRKKKTTFLFKATGQVISTAIIESIRRQLMNKRTSRPRLNAHLPSDGIIAITPPPSPAPAQIVSPKSVIMSDSMEIDNTGLDYEEDMMILDSPAARISEVNETDIRELCLIELRAPEGPSVVLLTAITNEELEKFANWVLKLLGIPLDFQYESPGSKAQSLMPFSEWEAIEYSQAPNTSLLEAMTPLNIGGIESFMSSSPVREMLQAISYSSPSPRISYQRIDRVSQSLAPSRRSLCYTDISTREERSHLEAMVLDEPSSLAVEEKMESSVTGSSTATPCQLSDVAHIPETYELEDCMGNQEWGDGSDRTDVSEMEDIVTQDEDIARACSLYDESDEAYHLNEYDVALSNIEVALEIFLRKLGRRHVCTLRALLQKSWILCRLNQYEAKNILNGILRPLEETLGANHDETREAYRLQAQINMELADYPAAWNSISKALAGKPIPDSLDDCHDLETLMDLELLADWYFEQRQYDRSCVIHKILMERKEALYGIRSLHTVEAIRRHGTALLEQGLYKEAMEQFQTAKSTAESCIPGEILENTFLDPKYNIGQALYCMDREDESEILFLEELKAREKLRGTSTNMNADILYTVYTLAVVKEAQGNHHAAIEYYERALIGRKQIYGQHHRYTIRVLEDITSLLNDRGLIRYSKPLSQYVLKCYDKYYGPFDSRLLRAFCTAAEITLKDSGLDVFEL